MEEILATEVILNVIWNQRGTSDNYFTEEKKCGGVINIMQIQEEKEKKRNKCKNLITHILYYLCGVLVMFQLWALHHHHYPCRSAWTKN